MGALHYHPCSLLRRSRDTRGAAFQNCQGVQGRKGTWGGRSTKIQKNHETSSGPGRFDNQKLILLELLDLATPHLPEGFGSKVIARAITFTLPLLWTELKRGNVALQDSLRAVFQN
jgi:hypothetical protein